ncbi:MAG: hypothetical protein EHM59_21825 [Betaproteobacteria bacterium]|nr:MAG: hypothetical protein EHM59_21825 [Betaproteobacteria bacterium]
MKREAEIFCPLCAWRPKATDRWCCPPCRTEWNTFWTRGLCPGCGHQWVRTQCLACGEWSLHERWYHYPDGEELPAEEAEVEDTKLAEA